MGLVTKPNTPTTGAVISAADTNSNLDTLYNLVNGALDNANITAGAAIGNAKLNLASIAQAIALSGGLSMTSSAINLAKGADIASAATTSIWITDGNLVHVTGSTGPITSFGTAAQIGATRLVVFDSTPTITYNATSLILPTSANIVAAAGDVALVVAETTANARVVGYWRRDGSPLVATTAANALSGSVIQVVNTQTGAVSTGTTVIPKDDTIPQITEGDQYMSLAITPNNASNKLKIEVVVMMAATNLTDYTVALFQDSTADALASINGFVGQANSGSIATLTYYMTTGTVSSTTFRVRVGNASGFTMTFNGTAGGRLYGGVAASSITISEIKV